MDTKTDNPWDVKSIYELQYFHCPKCVYINHSKQEFIIHASEMHPEARKKLSNIVDGSLDDVYCPWEAFDSFGVKNDPSFFKDSVLITEKTVIAPKPRNRKRFDRKDCFICLESFKTSKEMLEHRQTHKKLHDDGKFYFDCNKCDKIFPTATYLQRHVHNIHMDVKLFECMQCDHQVNLTESFVQQLCRQCDNQLTSKGNLVQH